MDEVDEAISPFKININCPHVVPFFTKVSPALCLSLIHILSATPDTFVVTVNHIAGVAHKVQIGTSTDVSFIVVGNIIGCLLYTSRCV